MSETNDVSHWIDLVKHGDSAAANRIWQHYFDRLVRSVRRRLSGQNRAVSDEEDIVLSVFDSFYAAAEQGRFPDLSDRDDLWRLLLRMAARKVIDKRRHDQRQRRGGDVEVHSLGGDDGTIIEAIGDEPSPEMVLTMQESLEQFFSHLGVGRLRDLAVAKLEGIQTRNSPSVLRVLSGQLSVDCTSFEKNVSRKCLKKMSVRHKKLPIAALERIDDLCAEFEKKWQANEPATIESVLGEGVADVEREVLLAELVVLEIDYRRRRGESPTKQEYLSRFPDHVKAIEDALKEEKERTGAFSPPTVGQLSELFPALEIMELLGAGGMGAVYKARQKGLDRVVALKILPEEFAHDVKFALRFTREARTLAKLNHPNIVSVFEFGKVDDTYYFLMEFVDGSTLRDVVAAGQLPPEHALAIVPHLCDALQYAHDQGVIHRDIKPENILMAKDGSVKIADFGLSRILGNDNQPTALTRSHHIMGTPRYMAPEQFEGARGVDHRADIYSLGVVFYEMLTGELPIGRFAVPSQKVKIDVRLDEVVLRTLEKEPQRRYQHASQIKSDVQTIASTNNPALAPTMVLGKADPQVGDASEIPSTTASLHQQELAARLLLTRRELMDRVRTALKPLFRGQLIQILIGVVIIILGAQCWAQNTHVPHRLVCGVILHVYGLLVIAAAAAVCTRIKRIDYSEPIDRVRSRLDDVRNVYLRFGAVIGFPWWLMWIPVAVAVGFDVVMHPNCLIPSLVVGVVGLVVSYWLYLRVQRSNHTSAEKWRQRFAGESLANAYLTLREIEQAQVR